VLGNHDYYGDARRMSRALIDAGVTMLENSRMFLQSRAGPLLPAPPEGPALCIAGLDDFVEGHIDIDAALAGVPATMPRLLLQHNPDAAEYFGLAGPAAPRVDLMVSGHTHGGQVALPFLGSPIVPSLYGQKYAGGLVEGPAFRVLVSRGIGMAILPVRLGVPPELVEFTLIRG
jgi:uncharacterized protein